MGNGQSTVDTSERTSPSLSTCSKNEIIYGQLGQQRTFLRFAFGVSKLVAMTGHEKLSVFLAETKERRNGGDNRVMA